MDPDRWLLLGLLAVRDVRGPVQWAYHLLLPWLAFGAVFAAIYARMIRASVLEVYDADHVAPACIGMSEGADPATQVLRNALLPLVTMLGMDIGIAFGGAIFVERAFGLPGIGKLLISSLGGRDLPMILGIVVLVTTAILVFNLLVDLLYPLLDPGSASGREPLSESALEVAARARADDGRPRLAGRRTGSQSGARGRRSARARRRARRCPAARGRPRRQRRSPPGSARSRLHGLHHGAQKSTIVVPPGVTTSSSNVASVTYSHSFPPSAARRERAALSRSPRARSAGDIFEPPTSRSAKRDR